MTIFLKPWSEFGQSSSLYYTQVPSERKTEFLITHNGMSDHEHHSEKTANYHVYLLRLWREEGESWRVSLQSTHTGERCGFADLQTAVQFIEKNLRQGEPHEENHADKKMA